MAASSRSASGERLVPVAGVAGFDGRNLDDLRRGLTHLDAALDLRGRESLCIPFLAGARLSGAGHRPRPRLRLGPGGADQGGRGAARHDLRASSASRASSATRRWSRASPARRRSRSTTTARAGGRAPDPGRGGSLAALDELVLAAHNFAELARAIEAAVAPLFGAEKTGIMVFDEEREVLQMVGGSFAVSREVALSCQIKVLDPTSNWARVFTTGRGDFSNAATKDPGITRNTCARSGSRS